MSRKGSQNTKNDEYFSKISSQRCKATESLQSPSISKMTRRAYLARMCMLDRVIRGRGRASFKIAENLLFEDLKARVLKVCHILTSRLRQNNFLMSLHLKRKSLLRCWRVLQSNLVKLRRVRICPCSMIVSSGGSLGLVEPRSYGWAKISL